MKKEIKQALIQVLHLAESTFKKQRGGFFRKKKTEKTEKEVELRRACSCISQYIENLQIEEERDEYVS